jgi:hypothetical protein
MIQIVPLFVSALALLSTVSAHVDEWCDKEYGAPNSTYKECVHGEFRCTENSTDRCNWGVWKVDPCPIGTRCLACGDYECVLDFQFEDLSKQLCPPYEKMMEEKKQQKEKGKVEGPCEHGAFRCTNNSTDRCDHGVWFSHPCVQGTKCLGCGDWEVGYFCKSNIKTDSNDTNATFFVHSASVSKNFPCGSKCFAPLVQLKMTRNTWNTGRNTSKRMKMKRKRPTANGSRRNQSILVHRMRKSSLQSLL